jgi:hypothetical protein
MDKIKYILRASMRLRDGRVIYAHDYHKKAFKIRVKDGYKKDEVWKQIRIDIEDGQLTRYTSIDPKTNKKETIK